MTAEYLKKRVVLYGGGYLAKCVISWIGFMGTSVEAIMESNAKLWNTGCADGIRIRSYIDVLLEINNDKDEYVIITCFQNDDAYLLSLRENEFFAFSWEEILELFVNMKLKREYYVDYSVELKKWFMELRTEIDFWENAYAKPNARKRDKYMQLIDTIFFTEPYLTRYVREGDVVMDIGSGILSRYGSRLSGGGKINLLPIDPLASWYNLFNKKYLDSKDIWAKEKICFGIFEGLSYFYVSESADVIIVSNALDHCIDPFRSILECFKVLKVGGTLLLKHLRREGINERETGLHQWNVDVSNRNDLLLWNRINYINVSNVLKDYAEIKITLLEEDERGYRGNFGFIVVEIVKCKNIDSASLYDQYEEKKFEKIVKQIEESFKDMAGKDYMDKSLWENAFCAIEEK